jgi:hypothetical protein
MAVRFQNLQTLYLHTVSLVWARGHCKGDHMHGALLSNRSWNSKETIMFGLK